MKKEHVSGAGIRRWMVDTEDVLTEGKVKAVLETWHSKKPWEDDVEQVYTGRIVFIENGRTLLSACRKSYTRMIGWCQANARTANVILDNLEK